FQPPFVDTKAQPSMTWQLRHVHGLRVASVTATATADRTARARHEPGHTKNRNGAANRAVGRTNVPKPSANPEATGPAQRWRNRTASQPAARTVNAASP